MKLLKRILQIVLVVVVLLVVVGGAGGYWFITKSFPQIDGTLQVKGLKAEVQVVRDAIGVPHIYAVNPDDLFFAQGYVEAQDRLWQMDFNRRVGHGTLSEMFGAVTLSSDRYLRTMGLGRAARTDVAALSPADLKPLEAFSRGVNAFIETHSDNLPLEYTLLGVKPAPWSPVDTYVFGKVMAYQLGNNYDTELLRTAIAAKVGVAKMKEMFPAYPATGPFIVSPEAKKYTSTQSPSAALQLPMSIGNPDVTQIASIDAMLRLRGPEFGSNEWVIDGSKTTTGKPILASDQHLGIGMPSIWYEIGLHCAPKSDACPYNVAGVTFPGVPGVVVGHNDRIAWAPTNCYPDVQDLYVEEINPQNANQAKFNGKWEDIQTIEEVINVKGATAERLRVQVTRHGPIMTPVLSGVTQPLALQWTALRERSRLIFAVDMINRAQNWSDFRAALKFWDVPSQNMIYADVDGNIGYQMPGNVPIRAQGDGTVPVPGTGEYEWTGYIPFEELPFVYNPSTHFIAAPNNAVVPTTYKYFLGTEWASPYRALRIVDLLQAKDKLSIEDIQRVQGDVYSIPLATLQKSIAAVEPDGLTQQRAMEYVKTWDGNLTLDNVGGTIVEVTYQKLARRLFADKIGDEKLLNNYLSSARDYHRQMVSALLSQPKNEWWGNAGRDGMLKASYAEAVDWLASQYGNSPADWKWSKVHTATFGHQLGAVKPLDLIFNAGPVAVPGGVNTVFATSYRDGAPYATTSVTSQRQIFDLGDWNKSVAIHTTGQSGQPLNKHYTDMVLLWRDVKYVTFPFDRAPLDKVKEGTLILQP